MPHHSIQGEDGYGTHYPNRSADNCSHAPQLDAGQHPAYDGLAALPFFDDFDLSTVDVLLISQ